MDWILSNLLILGMIVSTAREAQVPPELVLAIIETESFGNPYAAVLNATYPHTMLQTKRPASCSIDTERIFQKTAWGLMQVMGGTARELHFEGWLPELTVPETNVRVGVIFLKNLMSRFFEKHGITGVIAAYNAGAPRRRADGAFINQGYVDRVVKAMKTYEDVVKEEFKEELKESKEKLIEATEQENTDNTNDDAKLYEIDLGKMNRAQLLDFAKLHGITVDPKAKLDEIRDIIGAIEQKEP